MSDVEPVDPPNPEKTKVLNVYWGLGITLLLGVVPHVAAAGASLVMLLVVLIWAYIARGKFKPKGLGENHMTFLIRTIWIGSFISILTMIIGSVYMLMAIDNAPLMPCMHNLFDVVMDASNLLNVSGIEEKVWASLGACTDEYLRVNLRAIIISGVVVIGPVVVYFVWRYVRGLTKAVRGIKIDKETSWL